nr:hypothetical protein CFP56_78619 [Quercus suber]
MEGHFDGHYGHPDAPSSNPFTSADYSSAVYETDLLTGAENFDMSAPPFDSSLPYRWADLHDGSSSFLPRHFLPGHEAPIGIPDYHARPGMLPFDQLHQVQDAPRHVPAATPALHHVHQPLLDPQAQTDLGEMQRAPKSRPPSHPPPALRDAAPTHDPLQQPGHGRPLPPKNRHLHPRPGDGQSKANAAAAAAATSTARPLQPAVPGQHLSQTSSQVDRTMTRRGGRRRHTHLPDQARIKSHKMRKTGACWGCALQRDPKGHIYYFPCDRSKLPDLVLDFLPRKFIRCVISPSYADPTSRSIDDADAPKAEHRGLRHGPGPTLGGSELHRHPSDVWLRSSAGMACLRIRAEDDGAARPIPIPTRQARRDPKIDQVLATVGLDADRHLGFHPRRDISRSCPAARAPPRLRLDVFRRRVTGQRLPGVDAAIHV